MTATEVALLGEREALRRLELLTTVSDLLNRAFDDYSEGVDAVAEATVEHFADLCVVEVIGQDGGVGTIAYRASRQHGLHLDRSWLPVGRQVTPDRRPILAFRDSHTSDGSFPANSVMERLGAHSLLVVPASANGITLGWLVAATGPNRRGFRPSALKVAVEMAGRIGATMHAVSLRREMQGAARDQSRTVRRLRRLAAAATNLAGAATTQAVLETACLEACAIHEAKGAVALWSKADGSTVSASAGAIDENAAARAFDAVAAGRPSRANGWVAYPLPNTDPWQHGALVVFVAEDLTGDEEPVLSSLASLIPVAFERALGTEAALKHEARLRAVVDSSPVVLFEVGPSGEVSQANVRAQEMFGWDEAAGPAELPPSIAVAVHAVVAEATAGREVAMRSAHYEGRELSFSGARLPPVHTNDEESVLIAGVDLTEIRRAERALIQAQRLDAMGQVAGRVAHDFNNLLTLIIGYASILRRTIDDDRHLDMIANIESASKRAAVLTQQMLDMTRQRVDTGAVIDLGAAVDGLDAVLGRVVGPQVDLRIDTPAEEVRVRLDPSEMEQIVVNLVINACDAMANDGRVEVEVEVPEADPATRRRFELPNGPLAQLTVSDDGPGMPEEVLAQCLEPFFTTKERGKGTGLGLPTVYGLVRERAGQMHIESAPGRGTTIRIWLPLESAPVTGGADESESWPEGRRLAGRVLLVEDEAGLREMALEALESVGLHVDAFAAAEDALRSFTQGGGRPAWDVLVTDVILPRMSGMGLVTEVRAIEPELAVIYTTAYTGHDDAPDPGDPVILKPYTPDQLRLRVAEVLEDAAQGSKR